MRELKQGDCAIAVLGCGMLGREVLDCLLASGYDVQAFDLPNWNICAPGELAAVVSDHDVIINCAAYTDVDGAEQNESLAAAVNTDAPGHLGELAAKSGRYVIHVSTDYVFNGEKASPYLESDPVSPVNVYGRTKAAGEDLLRASACRHCILRVQWSYGAYGVNFITKIMALARNHEALRVVNDQTGTPGWTRDMAAAIRAIMEQGGEGTLHYAARGSVSRYDLASFVLRQAGISCRLTPCSSEEFPTPARRPLNSVFDCTAFDREIGLPRPDWDASVAAFLETLA